MLYEVITNTPPTTPGVIWEEAWSDRYCLGDYHQTYTYTYNVGSVYDYHDDFEKWSYLHQYIDGNCGEWLCNTHYITEEYTNEPYGYGISGVYYSSNSGLPSDPDELLEFGIKYNCLDQLHSYQLCLDWYSMGGFYVGVNYYVTKNIYKTYEFFVKGRNISHTLTAGYEFYGYYDYTGGTGWA